MQQRAGILFLSTGNQRILLILENQLWTLPTFERNKSLLEDASELFENFSTGKVLPIELYTSEDRGFEYGTYVCLVPEEFLIKKNNISYAWCKIESMPKNLHSGLKNTLLGKTNQIKTILELFENY